MKKILLQIFRHLFIFADIKRPILPGVINLLWYNKKINGKYNVGDYLSVIVTDFLFQYKRMRKFPHKTKRLAVIGSIIQFISAPATLFGSGFLIRKSIDILQKKKPNLNILAVRGPLTMNELRKMGYNTDNTVMGDPAILMPYTYKPSIKKKKYDYIVIPHYSKLGSYGGAYIVSTLTKDWKGFIDEIVSAKLVISSSLHGIILADAYGIPCVMLNDTESLDMFKYEDYYLSTGRKEFLIANTVEEALSFQNIPVPNLSAMQEGLLKQFLASEI